MTTIALASAALVCTGVGVLGVALSLSPVTPGRLAYFALLASGSTSRLAVAASIASLLVAPAAMRARGSRWLARGTLGAATLAAGLSVAMSTAIIRAARSHRLPVSLRDSLFGAARARSSPPEVVTFATGSGWRLEADLYPPRDDAPSRVQKAPVVIVVHGGAWHAGGKGENPAWNHWLAARGYMVLDIEYRLAPAANWRQQVDDIWSAVAWVRSRAAELGADPDRVALLGRSAGGHLALMAAYAQDPPTSGVDRARVWGVIALYAPADVTRLYAEACRSQLDDVLAGLRSTMGGGPSDARDAYQLASPWLRAHADAPPTLLIHGALDRAVRPEHSRLLARALQRVGVAVRYVSVPFAPHAFDLVADGLPEQLARAATAAFLSALN